MPISINEQQFTSEVLDVVADLEELGFCAQVPFGIAAYVMAGHVGGMFGLLSSLKLRWFRWFKKGKNPQQTKQELEQAADVLQREAFEPTVWGEKLRLREALRTALCPAIKSISGDVFEVAKVSTPILLSLSLAGTITLPVQPLVFGMMAVLIVRSGVATVCTDSPQDGGNKK
ncbi:MAG: hypothetical protein ACREUI_11130 [Burkholderiales bacterium]